MKRYFAYLDRLRLAELEQTLDRWGDYFERRDLLEIGSGSGVQLARLIDVCRTVRGVELEGSLYRRRRIGEIREYNGIDLPFEDDSFDVIYSSNVLEHCREPERLHRDMQRVLRPGGVGVHVMPSHWWRLWSHLTHYPALPKKIWRRVSGPDLDGGGRPARRSRLWFVVNALVDPRHGEFGNRFSEIWEFHPRKWRKRLQQLGWVVIADEPSGMFYTGGGLMAGALGFPSRQRLAGYLGSACHTYIVAPADGAGG